jgi:hypothetical protein
MSVNLTAAQARALAAYAVPGRRLFVEQEAEARIHGGPIAVAIGAQPSADDRAFRRLAEATIREDGSPEWKAA